LKRTGVIVATTLLALVMYTLALSVLASIQTSRTVSSTGEVKAIGVSLYQNIECTNPLSSIPWGLIGPGETKYYVMYARNEGDYNIYLTLDIAEDSWSPTEASKYLVLSWDYNNSTIIPNKVVKITLSLYCDPSVTGIDIFSFNIIITGVSID